MQAIIKELYVYIGGHGHYKFYGNKMIFPLNKSFPNKCVANPDLPRELPDGIVDPPPRPSDKWDGASMENVSMESSYQGGKTKGRIRVQCIQRSSSGRSEHNF